MLKKMRKESRGSTSLLKQYKFNNDSSSSPTIAVMSLNNSSSTE